MNLAGESFLFETTMEQSIREAFTRWRGHSDRVLVARAPGRVNLIGDHTDYNEGLVLPMILDKAVYVAARPSTTKSHHLRSENYRQEISYSPGGWPEVPDAHWACYVAGMIRELPPPNPVEILVMGDVPWGAGLSSSAALEMATGLALETLRGPSMDPLQLARIGQIVEHRYVGVQCGIMDQIASRVGRTGHVLFLDCQTLEWEHIPIPSHDVQVVVMDSRVKRQLAGSKYNERRSECQEALQCIQASDPGITSLRQVAPRHIHGLTESVLQRRVRHVLHENERVRTACSAIAHSDWLQLGRILSASHASLRDDYQVSCEELDFMVSCADSQDGVFGSRMMGGGFGGCSIHLVLSERAHSVIESVQRVYEERFQLQLQAHVVGKGLQACVQWL